MRSWSILATLDAGCFNFLHRTSTRQEVVVHNYGPQISPSKSVPNQSGLLGSRFRDVVINLRFVFINAVRFVAFWVG
jgi:hypothetical protein